MTKRIDYYAGQGGSWLGVQREEDNTLTYMIAEDDAMASISKQKFYETVKDYNKELINLEGFEQLKKDWTDFLDKLLEMEVG